VNRFLALFAIILVGVSAFFYMKYSALKSDPSKEAQAEVTRLVAQVSKLMVLPEGENPTIATVTDVEKLSEQPFFAKAKNGNKVLIYTGAKKAILFDPMTNKIIEVAPINIGDSAKKTQQKPVVTEPAPTTETTNQ
jgi:hypothetical protein